MPGRSIRFALALFGLIAATLAIAAYKLVVLHYELGDVLPRTRYRVVVALGFDGHGSDVELKTFLPTSDLHQLIAEEEGEPAGLHFSAQMDGLNRRAAWSATHATQGTSVR